MQKSKNWYEIIRQKDYLYVIRERLDQIEPRFLTKYLNLYLLVGNNNALLIDTGCGLFPLKPLIDEIVKDKTLLVINTHSHFDHIGANDEFKEVMIHENERKKIIKTTDVSFLKYSVKEVVNNYKVKDFKLKPANSVKTLKNSDNLDLGGISLKIIHTPGHSKGSVCLISNTRELFTGDTAHYGSMYLPKQRKFPLFLESIQKLIQIYDNKKIEEIYPSHEQFAVKKDLLVNLYNGMKNIEKIWKIKIKDKFLGSWILQDEFFRYIVEKNFRKS
ncbi:MAG: MBL fold metallo-hydrolase [Candidatus Hodarchaeota archaeon]